MFKPSVFIEKDAAGFLERYAVFALVLGCLDAVPDEPDLGHMYIVLHAMGFVNARFMISTTRPLINSHGPITTIENKPSAVIRSVLEGVVRTLTIHFARFGMACRYVAP